jgi:hypothetical protein
VLIIKIRVEEKDSYMFESLIKFSEIILLCWIGIYLLIEILIYIIPEQNLVNSITGGSSGIGKSLAEKFAKQGFNLILLSSSKEKLENTQKENIQKQKSKSSQQTSQQIIMKNILYIYMEIIRCIIIIIFVVVVVIVFVIIYLLTFI